MLTLSNPGYTQRRRTGGGGSRECMGCGGEVDNWVHHCSACDLCCEGFSHHCVWLGKCIGYRNRMYWNGYVLGLLAGALLAILLLLWLQ
jgi:predicted amidophosphoribosyltransferase